jgi:hypothetical protein
MSNHCDDLGINQLRRAVRRSIVDDEDLFDRPGLRQDRVDHDADHIGIVPSMDVDENPHCRSLFPSFAAVSATKRSKGRQTARPRCAQSAPNGDSLRSEHHFAW